MDVLEGKLEEMVNDLRDELSWWVDGGMFLRAALILIAGRHIFCM